MELRSRKKKTTVKKETSDLKPTRVMPTNKKKAVFQPFGITDIFRFLLGGVILASIMSYLTTETLFFHYEFPTLQDITEAYFPEKLELRNFTIEELAQYDGSNGKPIYLAVKGKVYDVSAKPAAYGPDGSYKFFAAKDASRAYGTGCFADHLTHDLRGLTDEEMKGVEHWVDFYAKHKDYKFIGYVDLPEPTGPIPEHCKKEEE